MNEASLKPARNRLAIAGLVINCLGFIVFFYVLNSESTITSSTPASETSETSTAESGFEEAISTGLGTVFGSLATIMAAMFLGGMVWIVGTICCLIALIWKPRRWAVAGLLLIVVFVGGTLLMAALKTPQQESDGKKTATVPSQFSSNGI